MKLRNGSMSLAVEPGGPTYTIPKNCFYAESEIGSPISYYITAEENSTVEILLWS